MPLVLQRADIVQDLLADSEDLPLERVLVLDLRAGGDDGLADRRHRLDHRLAEAGEVGRHVAPTDEGLALPGDHFRNMLLSVFAGARIPRQEAHSDGVAAGFRQAFARLVRPIVQQAVRHLDQAAGAVAHQRVGADRAAVVEVDQDFQALADQVVRLSALDIDDEADAAGVMLVAWVVEALFRNHFHVDLCPGVAGGGSGIGKRPLWRAGADPGNHAAVQRRDAAAAEQGGNRPGGRVSPIPLPRSGRGEGRVVRGSCCTLP